MKILMLTQFTDLTRIFPTLLVLVYVHKFPHSFWRDFKKEKQMTLGVFMIIRPSVLEAPRCELTIITLP